MLKAIVFSDFYYICNRMNRTNNNFYWWRLSDISGQAR